MLERRDHHHPRVVAEDVLRAVAVVNVEVGDAHALQSMMIERVGGADRDVVEEAETHGVLTLGVVPRGPDRAEGGFRPAAKDEIDRVHRRPRGAQRGPKRERVHCGVGIQVMNARLRDRSEDAVDVLCRVHPFQVFALRCRGVSVIQVVDESGGNQLVFNGTQPQGTLWMVRAHVMRETVYVGNEQSGQNGASLRRGVGTPLFDKFVVFSKCYSQRVVKSIMIEHEYCTAT